ncbi:hypothetical protein HanRHA438_Chr02g0062621 [Helianthus annuus]|nr:hypothetical protein HanRHA438_Chr02g0062621 [Helianthus annuus]
MAVNSFFFFFERQIKIKHHSTDFDPSKIHQHFQSDQTNLHQHYSDDHLYRHFSCSLTPYHNQSHPSDPSSTVTMFPASSYLSRCPSTETFQSRFSLENDSTSPDRMFRPETETTEYVLIIR